jgi:hypothetical protein
VNALAIGGVGLYQADNRLMFKPEWSNDRKRLLLKLMQPLQPHTRYTLKIEGVTDLSGNVMMETERSFTTGSGADLYFPALMSYTPPAQSSGVGVNAPVVLNFSEAINPVSLHGDSLRLLDVQRNQVVATKIIVSDDRRQAIITPLNALQSAGQYSVFVSYYDSIYDQAGNYVPRTSWSFSP